jgi:hypothetical protein
VRVIKPTDEMKAAFRDAQRRRAEQLVDQGALLGAHDTDILDHGLAAVLAIVERDRSDAAGLTRAANAARRIADRYGEKGNDRSRADWRMWTAMSAGARAVTIRLAELADAEEAP